MYLMKYIAFMGMLLTHV